MSGPTTAIIVADPVALLLSAAGIRAAMAIRQGYEDSAALAAEHAAQHGQILQTQHAANLQGQQAMLQQLAQSEAEFAQLSQLADSLGASERILAGRPTRPDTTNDNDAALISYLRTLQSYSAELKSILLTESARLMGSTGSDETPAFQEFANLAASEVEPESDAVMQTAARLLARIAHLGALPQQIQQLAQQLNRNLPTERAELLTSELRRQIQLHLEQTQQQQVQEATALVLQQSLKDLGYQVEEFSSTLFVEGGVVHFRRHDWGAYMVRMRINEATGTANFNVIRSVTNASNERSVLDHLAEDRWCAEFPALLKALEACGLGLNVTRRLEAGELPVQLVNKDLLPQFAEHEDARTSAPLLSREIPL
ncbi:hypothetical protein [Solimicrobium silvestre]|uniref:Uncharacterized protein n=1 Tax=Solimicrobium silvestre TaxID=2099400 RepID=A0A2S9GYX1_9BURK|nr:hypothetical protein [Solimicrobium silvestre]PRC92900.1 hypothetical protein S2091_2317 [Solimicrobium silvestre]